LLEVIISNLKNKMMVNLKRCLFCMLLFFSMQFFLPNVVAQTTTKTISGVVVDAKGEPLIGVSILLKGTSIGTITTVTGKFTLSPGTAPDPTIVVSYVGYAKQEIKINSYSDKNNISITLLEDAKVMDEVVVVGYGNQKKLSIVGAIQALEPTKLQVGSSRSMSNNLAGQLAGIIAVQPSGEPGYDNSKFWIRGIASFSGNTSPLVLVDGVERSLNDIDPAEIEAFSVLKDASASAMYGVRGANGVILINTKRGTVSAPSINMRVEQSIQSLPNYLNLLEQLSI
jgi:TonB-dependent SusC/RagA subfamily outer membrane receptor